MPLKDKVARRESVARAVRRHRMYEKAIVDGHPLALAAEAARHPMRPAHEMHKRLMLLPSNEARRPFKDEYMALLARCQAVEPADARRSYLQLRKKLFAALADPKAAGFAPPAPVAVDPFS